MLRVQARPSTGDSDQDIDSAGGSKIKVAFTPR